MYDQTTGLKLKIRLHSYLALPLAHAYPRTPLRF